MKTKPDFQLQKIYADGSAEEPMLYALEDIDGEWKMGRRGFLTASFALCGFFSGCASIMETASTKPETQAAAAPQALPAAQSAPTPGNVTGICSQNVTAHRLGVPTLLFTPDGRYLVSGGKDSEVKFWEIPSGELTATITEVPTRHIDFNRPECNLMLAASTGSDGILRYNLNTGEQIKSLKGGAHEYVKCLTVCPKGRFLASGIIDKTITLWRLPHYKIHKKLKGHRTMVGSMAFSPDGRFFASGEKGRILLWSVADWSLFHAIRVNDMSQVNHLVFSPDSRLLATGGTYDNSVRMWHVPSGKPYKRLTEHEYNLQKVLAFSPDGRFIATGTFGNRIHVWEVASGRPYLILHGQKRHVTIESLVFSPDGKYLISGGSNGTIKIWLFPSGRLLTCLFDPVSVDSTVKINKYQMKNEYGEVVTFTLPCGSPLPPGAVCTCNCVPGEWTIDFVRKKRPSKSKSGGTRFICTCDKICTCVPIV